MQGSVVHFAYIYLAEIISLTCIHVAFVTLRIEVRHRRRSLNRVDSLPEIASGLDGLSQANQDSYALPNGDRKACAGSPSNTCTSEMDFWRKSRERCLQAACVPFTRSMKCLCVLTSWTDKCQSGLFPVRVPRFPLTNSCGG